MNDKNGQSDFREFSSEYLNKTGYQKTAFAVGCFWGAQAYFKKVTGVVATRVGYTGGHLPNPTYEQVCAGDTGHMEAVEIVFDPKLTSFSHLLEHFWQVHNPVSRDKQGADSGSQYGAAVFYSSDSQKKIAEDSKKALEQSGKYANPIATRILPRKEFYPAEEYHQDYLDKNPGGYCHIDLGGAK
ncbi:MAG: peptide-methionine (S)-S-oxide reductase MsrA [Elusimicrobia bacterium]|nr:peptide-methionine (S)-S-oxide reductase MsrA [Elusimicrobiota bacterium]